jgi:hypothetical protein
MGKVKRSDKDFEDYDHDEEEEQRLEDEELGIIRKKGPEDVKNVNPVIDVVKKDDKMFKGIPDECEEPGCERPATKIWKGRKVCADHYDFYREKEQSLYTFYY